MRSNFLFLFSTIFIFSACYAPVVPSPDAVSMLEPTKIAQPKQESTQLIEQPLVIPIIGEGADNGVVVRLYWATVSRDLLKIELQISGIPDLHGGCPVSYLEITDESGNSIEVYQPQIMEEQPEKSQTVCDFRSPQSVFHFYHTYQLPQGVTAPNQINIQVRLGGFLVYPEDGVPFELPVYGPYKFSARLIQDPLNQPFLPRRSKSEGFNLDLLSIDISPSTLSADYCIATPDVQGWFMADPILRIDDTTIDAIPGFTQPNFNMTITPMDLTYPDEQCYHTVFPIDLTTHPEFIKQEVAIEFPSILLDRSEGVTDEICASIKTDLQSDYPDIDFVCHIMNTEDGFGFGFEITSVPNTLTSDDVYTLFDERLNPTILTNFRFENITKPSN